MSDVFTLELRFRASILKFQGPEPDFYFTAIKTVSTAM